MGHNSLALVCKCRKKVSEHRTNDHKLMPKRVHMLLNHLIIFLLNGVQIIPLKLHSPKAFTSQALSLGQKPKWIFLLPVRKRSDMQCPGIGTILIIKYWLNKDLKMKVKQFPFILTNLLPTRSKVYLVKWDASSGSEINHNIILTAI